MPYSISETAKRMGLTASTLRYYDKEGLLPTVHRTPGGARVFTEEDFRWLNLITCLKKAGMPLKDIRTYIEMVSLGEDTLEARLKMFMQQRDQISAQLAQLQRTLDLVNYKCWFYETAIQAGSEEIPKNMPMEEIPPNLREVRRWLYSEG